MAVDVDGEKWLRVIDLGEERHRAGELEDVLHNVGATNALAVPVICSAVFELESHVLDTLVDDPGRVSY